MNLTAKENNFLNGKEEDIAISQTFKKEVFNCAPEREDERMMRGHVKGDRVSSRATATRTRGTPGRGPRVRSQALHKLARWP